MTRRSVCGSTPGRLHAPQKTSNYGRRSSPEHWGPCMAESANRTRPIRGGAPAPILLMSGTIPDALKRHGIRRPVPVFNGRGGRAGAHDGLPSPRRSAAVTSCPPTRRAAGHRPRWRPHGVVVWKAGRPHERGRSLPQRSGARRGRGPRDPAVRTRSTGDRARLDEHQVPWLHLEWPIKGLRLAPSHSLALSGRFRLPHDDFTARRPQRPGAPKWS